MKRCERGAVAVWVAMLMPALLIAVGLGVDLAGHAAAEQELRSVALEAARRGCQELAVEDGGRKSMDVHAGRRAAERRLAAAGVAGQVTVSPDGRVGIRAEGSYDTLFLGVIGIDAIRTSGTAEADPRTVVGGQQLDP